MGLTAPAFAAADASARGLGSWVRSLRGGCQLASLLVKSGEKG